VLRDARAVHGGRSARDHLLAQARTHGIGARRVAEVLEMTGLTGVARRRAGTFSLGMGQRLGIAAALLGDPQTVVLDEPVNGLDPEGVLWVRHLLRDLAAEGRTVLLSSHLMSEMALTADHLVVLGRGRVLADAPVAEVVAGAGSRVQVRTPGAAELAAAPVALGVLGPEPLRLHGTATLPATAGDALQGQGLTLVLSLVATQDVPAVPGDPVPAPEPPATGGVLAVTGASVLALAALALGLAVLGLLLAARRRRRPPPAPPPTDLPE